MISNFIILLPVHMPFVRYRSYWFHVLYSLLVDMPSLWVYGKSRHLGTHVCLKLPFSYVE